MRSVHHSLLGNFPLVLIFQKKELFVDYKKEFWIFYQVIQHHDFFPWKMFERVLASFASSSQGQQLFSYLAHVDYKHYSIVLIWPRFLDSEIPCKNDIPFSQKLLVLHPCKASFNLVINFGLFGPNILKLPSLLDDRSELPWIKLWSRFQTYLVLFRRMDPDLHLCSQTGCNQI